MKFYFIIFILEFIYSSKTCIIDSDCWTKSRPDIHSMYCINNICQRIKPPEYHCINPTDCASYFFYGPLACTAKCHVENECEFDENNTVDSIYCCRNVPEGKDCMGSRPGLLSGCDKKQSCLINSEGEYKCMSRSVNSWIVGVILSVLGNLLINFGINLQKKSFLQNYYDAFGLKFKLFYLGVGIYVLGKISGFSSYIFGNQSLLASLGAVGLIANSIFAPMINNEIFTWKDFISIILVLTGTSFIVANSGRSHRVYSLCELIKLYKRKETVCWFGFILALIACLFFLIKFIEVNSDWAIPSNDFLFLKSETTYFEENGLLLKYIMVLFYVGLSGSIASLTTLFAKSFGEMIDKTISGENQFLFGVTYLFFILIVLFTTLQIYWLNRALRHYDALLVIPLFHVIWTLFSVATGGIYFQDFEHYSWEQFKGFLTGLGIIFLGSTFLGSRIMNRNKIETNKIIIEREVIKKD
ncbi:putative magnesium transporter NIPA8 [Astathelohania contejeani]|uniref:Magnesium transporter NIPA8 n=1 Tax=Astathelohania contejeani TaxID=164912 RepID=A0ABQ7HYA2_9MICR|nr:putative magnesium transporter NIPA8 [Thelohania contejeani]